MGSINRSHIEQDGGILLYNREFILLYCENVSFELLGHSAFKGRVFLTTHRLVTIVNPYKQNAPIKSVCAPFSAITRCSVEQPLFGANYIEATVREEADPNKSFSFKMKFPKGGAIEMAMAMNKAVAFVGRQQQAQPMPPPTAFTPSPTAQYYQAPPTVYAPGYDCGVQMPTQQFPDQPAIGFIYASTEPPPYPGLGGYTGGQQVPPQQQQQHHNQPPPSYNQPGYPTPQGYPSTNQAYPLPQGNPGQNQPGRPPAVGFGQPPQSQSYTTQPPSSGSNYPFPQDQVQAQAQQAPPSGTTSGYPMQPGNSTAQPASNQTAWPSAPAYNPNWSDDKKQA